MVDTVSQLAWSLAHLRAHGQQLLADAGYPAAAASLDPAMLASAFEAVRVHVEQEGDEVLPPWGGVPVTKRAGWRRTEHHAFSTVERGQL